MSNAKIILLLALILFVAGCTGTRPVKISSSDGLQINEFSADISDVFSGENVILSLEIENVGGTSARNINGKLFGGISGWGGDATAEKTLGRGASLEPPLIDSNVAGDFDRKTWSITAPELPQGLSQNYDIGVRVRYKYTTTSLTPVDIISYDQFSLLRRQNQFAQSTTVTKNSNAPIKISLEVPSPMRPVSVNGAIEETVTLVISNVGSGMAFGDISAISFPKQDNLGKIILNIKPTKGTLTCSFGDASPNQVTLRAGFDSVRVPCTFTVPAEAIPRGTPKETINVQIVADYAYAVDNTIPIRVVSNI